MARGRGHGIVQFWWLKNICDPPSTASSLQLTAISRRLLVPFLMTNLGYRPCFEWPLVQFCPFVMVETPSNPQLLCSSMNLDCYSTKEKPFLILNLKLLENVLHMDVMKMHHASPVPPSGLRCFAKFHQRSRVTRTKGWCQDPSLTNPKRGSFITS